MTLPSAVVPQKKEMEPPNQNASQMARIHINITILGGMPANRHERRTTLQLPTGTSEDNPVESCTQPTEQKTMFVKNPCYYTQKRSF